MSEVSEMRLGSEEILDVTVRFWAELGRMRMPIGQAVALSEGSIVDLDKKPEEAVDVYVNGTHFGTGRLIMVEGEWALQLESVDALPADVEQASTPSSDTA
ncbi:MAG: FliM/FliN family flagellar motor switch protein [Thermoleophilaceae bacterium]